MLMWKIMETSEALVLYIFIYIYRYIDKKGGFCQIISQLYRKYDPNKANTKW